MSANVLEKILKAKLISRETPEEQVALKKLFKTKCEEPQCKEVKGKMRCKMYCTPNGSKAEFFLIQQDSKRFIEFDMKFNKKCFLQSLLKSK